MCACLPFSNIYYFFPQALEKAVSDKIPNAARKIEPIIKKVGHTIYDTVVSGLEGIFVFIVNLLCIRLQFYKLRGCIC